MAQGAALTSFHSSPKGYLEFDLAGKEVLRELESRLSIPVVLQGNLLLRGPWGGGKTIPRAWKKQENKVLGLEMSTHEVRKSRCGHILGAWRGAGGSTSCSPPSFPSLCWEFSVPCGNAELLEKITINGIVTHGARS